MRFLVVFVVFARLALPAGAQAESRPTSGDPSILSGRTLGVDQTVLMAGVGWPGVWAGVALAPTSTFNISIRAALLYGSPVMGLGTGVGGELALPIRVHLYGKGNLDVAWVAEPAVALGEGPLAGEEGALADKLGYAAQLRSGAVAGFQVSSVVTIAMGLRVGLALADVPDANRSNRWFPTFAGQLSVEALMNRETMLFANLQAGIGLAPDRLFDGHGIVQASVGVAYIL